MKVAVLVSGGVDSSVALALLKEQGHDVTAFYLKIWLEDEMSFLGDCPWNEDLTFVQAVCKQLDVPLTILSLQKEYHERVVKYAIDEVKAGRTPNPDIFCNSMIKFGAFYEQVGHQYDAIATGHYADTVKKDGTVFLKLTPDAIKDQTYFLARLSQEQLQKVIFPIGKFTKAQVRELAQKYNLANKERKDSQGLCFLGKIKYRDFIKEHVGTQTGPLVVYETGEKKAEHEGFWFYTIGQRQGIRLSHGPWYVVKKDVTTNTVYISNQYYDSQKVRNTFSMTDILGTVVAGESYDVKLRHGEHMHKATVTSYNNEIATCALQESDQGIAAGQCAVFYCEGLVVASGVISE